MILVNVGRRLVDEHRRAHRNVIARAHYAKNPKKYREQRNVWNAEHREQIRARSRELYAANPERDKAYAREYGKRNRDKLRAKERRYRERNADRVREKSRRINLRRNYGLTPESLAALIASQDGLCAICGRTLAALPRTHIDHDHKTGRVRGVLCQHCNLFIGHAKEDTRTLQRAIAYLERNR